MKPHARQFAVRQAHKGDIPALTAVFQAAIRLTACNDYTPEQIEVWAKRGNATRFMELFDSGLCFFTAENGTECMGFAAVSLHVLSGHPHSGALPSEHLSPAHLHSLFVAPQFQRKGVASALLQEAVTYAKRHGAKNLTAEASITALPFFRMSGFTVVQEQVVHIGVTPFTNYRVLFEI